MQSIRYRNSGRRNQNRVVLGVGLVLAGVLPLWVSGAGSAASERLATPDRDELQQAVAGYAAGHPLAPSAAAEIRVALEALDADTPAAREAFQRVQQEYGEPILPILDQGLRNSSAVRRRSALVALSTAFAMRDDDKLALSAEAENVTRLMLSRAMIDEVPDIRIRAIGMARTVVVSGRTPERSQLIDELVRRLSDADARVQESAAFYLIGMGRRDLVPDEIAGKIHFVE